MDIRFISIIIIIIVIFFFTKAPLLVACLRFTEKVLSMELLHDASVA